MKSTQLYKIYITVSLSVISFNTLYAAELVSGLRVGYNNFAGVDLQYTTPVSDGRVGILHKGWDDLRNNIYLSAVFYPNYWIAGLGWNVRYGLNQFKINQQKMILDESTGRRGNHIWGKTGDLGTSAEGTMVYAVPTIYYHFFRESYVSALLGAGIGFSYVNAQGDIYLTDSYGRLASNAVCFNYLNNTESYEDVANYCEKIEFDRNSIAMATSLYLNIQAGNMGLEFGYVNAGFDKQDSDDNYGTTVSDLVGAIYYQFNF